MSRISLQEFIDKTHNKSIDVPWKYKGLSLKGECVSLVQQYVHQCFGEPLKSRGHAKSYGNTLIRDKVGKLVKTARYGDILVYDGNYGHVAICIDDKRIYDQNNYNVKPERNALMRPHLKNKPMQIIRMNKALVADAKPKYKKEVWAFTSKVKAINIRDNHNTNAKIVGKLKENETYDYIQKYEDGRYVWVSNGKTWLAVRPIKNGVRGKLWGTLQAQKNKPKKEYVQLSRNVEKWGFYKLGVQPTKKNIHNYIYPKKFGGLEYEVLGKPFKDTVTIQTRDYGKVNIWIGTPNAKIIKK